MPKANSLADIVLDFIDSASIFAPEEIYNLPQEMGDAFFFVKWHHTTLARANVAEFEWELERRDVKKRFGKTTPVLPRATFELGYKIIGDFLAGAIDRNELATMQIQVAQTMRGMEPRSRAYARRNNLTPAQMDRHMPPAFTDAIQMFALGHWIAQYTDGRTGLVTSISPQGRKLLRELTVNDLMQEALTRRLRQLDLS